MNQTIEDTIESINNWNIGAFVGGLNEIHRNNINIAIYERDIRLMNNEIKKLLKQNITFRASGNINDIEQKFLSTISRIHFKLIIEDIKKLLQLFKEVSNSQSFRLLFTTINSNMCRRFHTDINDLRLLCTYSGPGTLWLTEDNINRNALNSCGDNECIVLNENKIQQVKTGAVALLKGSLYPKEGTNAIVHRSPTIEETGEKRLLLRIDTNATENLLK